ncbi:argininosuccinate synthase [Dethiobacter alkaliphilus]|uniref:argininosuccinate synthase n=1 Tax=Dethiobacter alkaliphilus TaxID=427926 RepID=UPI002226B593|nr:argininosuccinate synthase [Dethiobacter alkaliphilus]MCW3490070.1 argininosuccinate synthase [Dethiobacter alkaliphilus]
MKKIILAYSGGLDTSIAITWLKEKYNCEVVAMAADVGQGEELEPLHEKALKSGASKLYIEDVREEFVRDFVFPMVKSGALYEEKYFLGTAIARPAIAKRLVEVAAKEGADAIAHGATGKGNDQVRFELTIKALAPHLKIVAPWREWEIRSRDDAFDYAEKHGIPLPVTKDKPYSMDRNIWHLSFEGGILEDPNSEPEKEMFILTVDPEDAPDKAEYVEIGFEKGVPVSLNGKAMGPVDLLDELNTIAGRHGVGRVDMVENRLVGMKSRGVYETPGGTLLYFAHKEMECLTMDRETMHFKEIAGVKYGELVYYGQWYTPLREALDAFIDRTQQNVTGSVRVKLYKGNMTVAGRKSPHSLYREDLATFGEDVIYDQRDAEGFINLFGLPLKVQGLLENEKKRG